MVDRCVDQFVGHSVAHISSAFSELPLLHGHLPNRMRLFPTSPNDSAHELCPGYSGECLTSSNNLGDSAKGLCFGECPASPCGLVDFVSGILNAQRNKKRELRFFEFSNTRSR